MDPNSPLADLLRRLVSARSSEDPEEMSSLVIDITNELDDLPLPQIPEAVAKIASVCPLGKIVDEDAWTLLHFVTHSSDEVFKAVTTALVNHGLSPNVLDNNGATPVRVMRHAANEVQIRHLLSLGADPAIPDRHGHTPLFDCAPHLASVFLEGGASLEHRDVNGVTPIMLAATRRLSNLPDGQRLELVRALLAAGADPWPSTLPLPQDACGELIRAALHQRALESQAARAPASPRVRI